MFWPSEAAHELRAQARDIGFEIPQAIDPSSPIETRTRPQQELRSSIDDALVAIGEYGDRLDCLDRVNVAKQLPVE